MNHPAIQSATRELDRIESSVERVFEGTPLRDRLGARIARTRRELEEIGENRGVGAALISVLGTKNAGKSWVSRCLLLDEGDRDKIRVSDEETTEKVCWIGPERPEDLDPHVEQYIPVSGGDLFDLGEPYQLLDVPGLNDMNDHAREAARQLTAATALRVFVVSTESWRDEEAYTYLEQSRGARILPVFVDEKFYTRTESERRDLAAKFEGLLHEHSGRTGHEDDPDLLDVVFIPRVKHFPSAKHARPEEGESPQLSAEQVENEGRERIQAAFRKLIDGRPVDPGHRAAARIELLKHPFRKELREFVRHVAPAYRNLVDAERAAAGSVVERLLGAEREMREGIRLRLLLALPDRTPLLLIPFRPFLTLLAFTSGANSRAVLAMTGSVASLAATALQSARNAKRLEEMRGPALEALRERAASLARTQLRAKNDLFLAKVAQQLPGKGGTGTPGAARKIELTGLDELQEGSRAIFEEEIERAARSRVLVCALGAAATAIFGGIGLAPIWAIYRAYFGAWLPAFEGPGNAAWQAFPAPAGAMILTTFIAMIFPAFVIALITVAIGARNDRVERCAESIRERHRDLAEKLSRPAIDGAPPVLRVVSDDPFREAVREILDFSGAGEASEQRDR